MKRLLSAWALVLGAGLASGQTPRPSVIPVAGQTPIPTVPQLPPATAPIIMEKPTVVPAPAGSEKKMEALPPPVPEKKSEATPSMLPPAVEAPPHAGPSQHSYESAFIEPCFGLCKSGRNCSTVYMSTPYLWFHAEYLIGWIKSDHSPPLVTTGPGGPPFAGVLDNPDTTVLFGGAALHDQPYYGGRFHTGFWFDECQYCGFELGFFFLASQDRDFIAAANGQDTSNGIYIPYLNAATGAENVFPVADPGSASGIIRINTRSRVLSADAHGLFSVNRGWNYRIDAIAGARFTQLEESITIEENVRPFTTVFGIPADVGIYDRFGCTNNFIGADLGFKATFVQSCWSFEALAKVALGGTHQRINNQGWTGVTFPGVPTVLVQGGRLTGPNNTGSYESDVFSFIPEVGMGLGWQPCSWLKFNLAYSWSYWNNVVRPGDQIDRVIDPAGIPTGGPSYAPNNFTSNPYVAFRETDFWISSITLGMQINY